MMGVGGVTDDGSSCHPYSGTESRIDEKATTRIEDFQVNISARPATSNDIPSLVPLYRALEIEQTKLRSMWYLADGLPEPPDAAFREILGNSDSTLVMGELDSVPLGFAWADLIHLLPQAEGSRVAVMRMIHTEIGARGVGIGEAMIQLILDRFRPLGITKYDARVSPGHRDAKNFFESHGFKARMITMHHDLEA